MDKKFPQIDCIETGKRIRLYMDKLHLSVKDVQKYMGFSAPQAIYHWLEGKSLPSTDNLYALSELFKVPIDQILCGSQEQEHESDMELQKSYYLIHAVELMLHNSSKNQQIVAWEF